MDTNPKEKTYYMHMLPPWINRVYADIKFCIDKISGFRKLRTLFYKRLGYHLNLNNPQSFNEKIIWKKLYDRNPLLPITADKYLVRSYIEKILGVDEAKKILVNQYFAGKDPKDIDFNVLPDRFVIKPNHGSGMHLIVRDKRLVNTKAIIKLCKKWLNFNYGLYQQEWAYRSINRLIIIEELLQKKDGTLPMDSKFYCFHGKCAYIYVAKNRFGDKYETAFFDPKWNRLPIHQPGYPPMEVQPEKPVNLEKMIQLAERLSAKFDVVRIDFYDCDEKIYFGEITHYDASGLARYEPESFDFETGKLWRIDKNYWINEKLD